MQLFGNVADGRCPATPAYIHGKPFGVERVVGKKTESFLCLLLTFLTTYATDFQIQIDSCVAAGKISYATHFVVIEAPILSTTVWTTRFFSIRLSPMTLAFGSPKIPTPFC